MYSDSITMATSPRAYMFGTDVMSLSDTMILWDILSTLTPALSSFNWFNTGSRPEVKRRTCTYHVYIQYIQYIHTYSTYSIYSTYSTYKNTVHIVHMAVQ